jgi:hypothetical protein
MACMGADQEPTQMRASPTAQSPVRAWPGWLHWCPLHLTIAHFLGIHFTSLPPVDLLILMSLLPCLSLILLFPCFVKTFLSLFNELFDLPVSFITRSVARRQLHSFTDIH